VITNNVRTSRLRCEKEATEIHLSHTLDCILEGKITILKQKKEKNKNWNIILIPAVGS